MTLFHLSFRNFGAARGVLTACPVSSAFPVVVTGLVRDPLLACADTHVRSHRTAAGRSAGQCGVPLLLDRIKQSMTSCKVRTSALQGPVGPEGTHTQSADALPVPYTSCFACAGGCGVPEEARDAGGRVWAVDAEAGADVVGGLCCRGGQSRVRVSPHRGLVLGERGVKA